MSNILKQTNAWSKLFEQFKEGENVIIVTEDDDYYWGKFKPSYQACIVGGKEYKWDEVVFIAHEGFPIKFLSTGIEPKFFEQQCTIQVTKVIRKVSRSTPRYESHYFCGGDPWLIEDVAVEGFNIGKGPNDEFLQLTSRDGLTGILYDLPLVFEFGIARAG